MAANYMALITCHTHAIIKWSGVVSADWHKELPVHPLVPRYLRSDADKMPVLLKLDELSDAQIEQFCLNLEVAAENPRLHLLSCLLDVSPETSTGSLVFHLAEKLLLNGFRPKGQKLLLYYYRSKAFLLLRRVFSPEQLCQFYGPVQSWTVPFQNEWMSFPPPQATGVVPELWMASDGQVQRIQRIGPINEVLGRQMKETNQRWESLDDFYADAEKIDRILVCAEQNYHLRDDDDLLVFAEHALKNGEHFHWHPMIQERLQVVAQQGWGYAQASAKLTEDDWKKIALSNNHTNESQHGH